MPPPASAPSRPRSRPTVGVADAAARNPPPAEPAEPAEPPIVTIVGDLVALGPQRRDPVPAYQCWMNALATLRTLAPAPLRPVTLDQQAAWYGRP